LIVAVLGGGYHLGSGDIIFMYGAKFKGIRIGYSYDITTSILRKYSSGSHELTLGYTLPKKKEKPEESGE